MKILLITDEVWNDKKYSNNVLTNWFTGFPATFANLYLAPGSPENPCCSKYFQVTDKMMALSILTGKEAGYQFLLLKDTLHMEKEKELSPEQDCINEKERQKGENERNGLINISTVEEENTIVYSFAKAIATESVRLLRDLIWVYGKYNTKELKGFIEEFSPDVIFSLRMASKKMLRIERLVSSMVNCPMIVFTGDDEFTLRQLRFSPIYWMRRLAVRKELRHNLYLYEKYYVLSIEQAKLYRNLFGINTGVLMKCGNFPSFLQKPVNEVIRIIYAGRLYCNRHKTLKKLRDGIERLNQQGIVMTLDIYTKEQVPRGYRNRLDDGIHSKVHSPVTASELKEIYQKADIALHVESFDLKNRWITKYSFSTKIIDCLGSTCAVMAICPKEHAGYTYLKKHKAAICVSDQDRIFRALKGIVKNPKILEQYQYLAWDCGHRYHERDHIQTGLYQEIYQMIRGD